MLANFLDKTKPIIFVVLVGFFFIAYFSAVFLHENIDGSTLAFGMKMLFNFVVYAAIFFFYNFVISKNNLTYDNAYAFFMFTLFLLVCLSGPMANHKPLVLLLQLLFIRKIYSLKSPKNVLQKLFDAGFWIGIVTLFEPIFVLFFLLVIIAILLHQKLTAHTLFTPILGFFSPLIIYVTYQLWIDAEEILTLFQQNPYQWDLTEYREGRLFIFIVFVLSLSVISLLIKSPFTLTFKNTFRRNWLLLLFHFILISCLVVLLPEKSNFEISYILFPATVIIANGVELFPKKLYRDVFFLLILGLFAAYFFYL